jgi:nucleoid-associated protein YgaU
MTFEMQSPRGRASTRDSAIDPADRADGQSRPTAGARRVETVPHVVERNENFWTISRQYYGSGRYYRALWKANADRCPRIDGLRVNDVIIIPPPEDLDPSAIEPPGENSRSSRGPNGVNPSGLPGARERRRTAAVDPDEPTGDSSGAVAAGAPAPRRGAAGARTNQLSNIGDSTQIQRSSRISSELELPAAGSDGVFTRDRRSVEGRSLLAGERLDDEPELRAARRPRSSSDDANDGFETRPAYKVRPNDTLRSIARDTLGNARRANEILELNREKIDDPSSLIVGQMLELPEDARTSIRRPASR